jgi:hypothetical protein
MVDNWVDVMESLMAVPWVDYWVASMVVWKVDKMVV